MNYITPNKPNFQHILTLMVKELRIHLLQNIFILLTPFLILIAGYFLDYIYFNSFSLRDLFFYVIRIGIFMPIFFGEFLIEREFKRKPLIFIRIMPIPDTTVYLSKISFCFFILLLSQVPGMFFFSLYFKDFSAFAYTPIIFGLFSFFTTLTLLLVLKLGSRVSFLIINIPIEILINLWKAIENNFPNRAAQIIASQSLFLAASIFLLIGTYIFYRLGVRHFQTRDTLELVA